MTYPYNIKNLPEIKGAVWHPYFSVDTIKKTLLFLIVFILLLAFGLPDKATSHWEILLYNFVSSIPGVRSMCSDSKFPFAYSISYFFAIFNAVLASILTCLTEINIKPYTDMTKQKSRSSRLIMGVGMAVFMLAFYFLDLRVSEHQFSYGFFELVSSNKILLGLWSGGIFLLFYVVWIYLFFEITNLVKFLFIRRVK